MNPEIPIYSVIFLFSSLLSLGVGVVARRRVGFSGSAPFSQLMGAVSIWMLCRAFEGGSFNLNANVFWAKAAYLGIPWVGYLWLSFCLRFVHLDKLINRRNLLLAGIIPFVTMLLVFTNEAHHLIWTDVRPNPVEAGFFIYTHGTWFWIAAAYNYLLVITGTVLMLVKLRTDSVNLRTQSLVLTIGALFPLIGNLVYLTGLSPLHGMDLTPFGFAIAGMIFAWTLLGLNLFLLVPIAREHLVDNLSDGVIVLDPNSLVADINTSAQKMLKIYENPIGKKIDLVSPDLAPLADLEAGSFQLPLESQAARPLELTVSPLMSPPIGRLVVIHDISRQIQAETHQIKARKRAEALNEITLSIYHKLEINELMELVYHQVNRFMDARFFLIAAYDQDGDEWESIFLREPNAEFPRLRYKSSEGITGYVIQMREPLLLNNTNEIDTFLEWSNRQMLASKPKSLMIVPLIGTNGVVGAMGTQNYDEEDYYSQDDFYFFSTVGVQIAAAFENARSFARMEKLATTDSLTGLYNRRYLFSLAQIEFEQALRYNHPLSAIMMDIDHFKEVNDLHGHLAGDQALQVIADICSKTFRKVDTVGRYGGEEFLIILPETNASQTLIAAERLRSRIAQADVSTQHEHIQVTVSIGVASLETADSLECLIEQADKALYAAKQTGRNQTRVYPG